MNAPVYQVLARKYRPQTFSELIGQDALVRVLTNAVDQGRIAQAFILTGVRGVGKTTTARIIARALNCIGPDGSGGPTASPCGVCEHCVSIASDRHVDVTEMDAASRTGVDDIRELIETVRYRPVSARFKVFIIDEVHMLSKNAFNALLKTLEEPPPDIKFVFATTEIQKVPVTVLSRCQRFSLPRVPVTLLGEHYARICVKEGVSVEPAALALIARAADGSVRDGLSMLDQAIALRDSPAASVTAAQVGDMLGIADRSLLRALFEGLMAGSAPEALAIMARLYEGGAEPLRVLQDLLELTHLVTRLKLTPEAGAEDPAVAGDREWALPFAGKLPVPVLTRAWQMLLKGLGEVADAPSPLQAAEMVLIRLLYAADLPTPADLARILGAGDDGGPRSAPAASPPVRPAASLALAAPPVVIVPPEIVRPEIVRPEIVRPEIVQPEIVRSEVVPQIVPLERLPADIVTLDAVETVAVGGAAGAALARAAGGSGAAVLAGTSRAVVTTTTHLVAVPATTPVAILDVPAEIEAPPQPQSFAEVIALCEAKREMVLRGQLFGMAHLVRFEPGRIDLRLADGAPRDVVNRLGQLLSAWTKAPWVVALSPAEGEPTLRDQAAAADQARLAAAQQDPLVRAVLETFPGAVIEAVRDLGLPAPAMPASDIDNPPPDDLGGETEGSDA